MINLSNISIFFSDLSPQTELELLVAEGEVFQRMNYTSVGARLFTVPNSKLTVHEIIEVSCGGLSENQDADRFHG